MSWLISRSLSGIILWGNFFYSTTEADPNNVPPPLFRVCAFIISIVMGPFILIPNIVVMVKEDISPKLEFKFW